MPNIEDIINACDYISTHIAYDYEYELTPDEFASWVGAFVRECLENEKYRKENDEH